MNSAITVALAYSIRFCLLIGRDQDSGQITQWVAVPLASDDSNKGVSRHDCWECRFRFRTLAIRDLNEATSKRRYLQLTRTCQTELHRHTRVAETEEISSHTGYGHIFGLQTTTEDAKTMHDAASDRCRLTASAGRCVSWQTWPPGHAACEWWIAERQHLRAVNTAHFRT